MFVDAKVCSLDGPVLPVHETGLTGFQDQFDYLKDWSNSFSTENTKSAMVIQNNDAAEVSVWGQSFISKILAVEVRHYFIFSYDW